MIFIPSPRVVHGNIAIYVLHPGMILISAACTGNIMLHKAFKVVAISYNFCYHLFQYGILLEIIM